MSAQAHYKFELKNIRIKNIDVKLYSILNIDELFDELIKKDKSSSAVTDEQIPYWAELWPSALALAEFLAENIVLIKGRNVLELGCGLGLPAIVAGMLEAKVTLTDYLQAPLDFAKKNWELNIQSPAQFEIVDWRNIAEIPNYQIILASDIAYEQRSYESIINTLDMFCNSGATVILSEPNRKLAIPFIQSLLIRFNAKINTKQVMLKGIQTTVNVYLLNKKQ